jgi:hypothetical protein
LVTVPPTVKVVPDIDEAVPEALDIEGSFENPVPDIEEFPPLVPLLAVDPPPPDAVAPAPPPPTIMV